MAISTCHGADNCCLGGLTKSLPELIRVSIQRNTSVCLFFFLCELPVLSDQGPNVIVGQVDHCNCDAAIFEVVVI
jgi:hypothetical protein